MFIIFFALFIFILTVRESIWIGGIVFVVIVISLGIFYYCKKFPNKKIFLIVIIAFALSLGSFLRNNLDTVKSSGSSTLATSFSKGGKDYKSFIGTGIIQDTSTAGKYIFTTSTTSYLLQSKKEHDIGEELFLVGNMGNIIPNNTRNLRSLKFFKSSPASAGLPTVAPFGKEDKQDQSFLSFDYPKRLKMKGLQGLIYESNSTIIAYNQAGRISQTKKNLQQKIIFLYGKEKVAGLILGMLIGDRSMIPADEYQNFISSGLVHLIAVSGGNLVMITVFLGLVLFFLPFYIRTGIILLAIIFYALLCGLDSSVFRAVITGGLSMLALFRGKEIPIWRLLSMAFIIMLIINPYYLVYDVGFLMSFAAVIGIIYISERKKVIKIEKVDSVPTRSRPQNLTPGGRKVGGRI
ncbi:MAG: ComEC/Rec2 family competence protein [candidate division SR1 bacterium]|nr:ComEC/Rec2 family competence protein [candidate division SR1 bacterium]